VCITWKIKCWLLLMHGVTMNFVLAIINYSVVKIFLRWPYIQICNKYRHMDILNKEQYNKLSIKCAFVCSLYM